MRICRQLFLAGWPSSCVALHCTDEDQPVQNSGLQLRILDSRISLSDHVSVSLSFPRRCVSLSFQVLFKINRFKSVFTQYIPTVWPEPVRTLIAYGNVLCDHCFQLVYYLKYSDKTTLRCIGVFVQDVYIL